MPRTTVLMICKIGAMLASTVVTAAGGEVKVDICKLVQGAEQYDNKIVVVTGDYLHGPHGATISEQNCGFQNRYAPFGSGAAGDIEYADSGQEISSDAAAMIDLRSIDRFHEAVARSMLRSGGQERRTQVSVLAVVKVAKQYSIHQEANGGYRGNGFGLMGRYPVQLLVLKIERFRIFGGKSGQGIREKQRTGT